MDLAGSERVPKTSVCGRQLAEACKINRSLHTLGNVIYALCDVDGRRRRRRHIPFRDSVLTRILHDVLQPGGRRRAAIAFIANVSPADMNMQETIATLRFAAHAKHVPTA